MNDKIDLTEQMQKRCEPIIISILQKMLDEKLLYTDIKYIEAKVLEYLEALLKIIVIEHEQMLFKGITESLKYHFRNATEDLWGKDLDNITLEDIDKVLKKRLENRESEV